MIPYQSSIGIEVREDSLVLVHLKRTLKEMRVQNSLILPVSFPLSPEAESEVVDSLKRFLRGNAANPERIVVGLPRRSVILKSLEIPSLRKENIPQILEYEIEKHIPFKPDDVYYDFEVIESSGENLWRILLAAVKRDIIDSLRDLFEKVPLRPKIFDVSSFGILNALRFGSGFSEDKIDTVIFMGSEDMELDVVQGGLLRYSRILRDREFSAEGLFRELEIAITGIDTGDKEKKINKVILSGPGALRPGLVESIKEKISPDTKVEDFSDKVTARPMEPQDRHSLIPAIGLALRGLGEAKLWINFLPHKKEIGVDRRRLYLTIILTGIVIFLGLITFASYPIKDFIEINRIEKRIESLRSGADAIEKIQTEIRKIEDKKRLINKLKADDLNKLDLLSEFTRVIPTDAWLVSLDYTEVTEQKGTKETNGNVKREITLSGFATSASKLIPLIEDSPIFENVEFAGPITSGVEGKEMFRIKASAKKTAVIPVSESPKPVSESGVQGNSDAVREVPKKEIPKNEVPKRDNIRDNIKEETLEPTEPVRNTKQNHPEINRKR